MSVLEVFGQNLRNLTALRGSQVSVAEELGINRVQFQRYLQFESFPKPNVLQRICEYFGVDARILTDLLDDSQLERIKSGYFLAPDVSVHARRMQDAMGYCIPDQEYLEGTEFFEDGIYKIWRGAYLRGDRAQQQLVYISTYRGAKVVRGYSDKRLFPPRFDGPTSSREFRGVMIKLTDGFNMITFHRAPWAAMTFLHMRILEFGLEDAFGGMSVISRGTLDLKEGRRVVRFYMYRLKGGVKEALKTARDKPLVPWDQVPDFVLPYIRPQNEVF